MRGLRVMALAAVVGAVAMAGPAPAAEPFQGKVRFEMTAAAVGDKPLALEYAVKKDVVRMDTKMAGMENYTLLLLAEKKILTVMPTQKMYMEMPFPKAAKATEEAKKPEITRTGKTEKVAFKTDGTKLTRAKAGEEGGKIYEAEEWLVKTEGATSALWYIKDLAPLVGLVDVFKSMPRDPTAALGSESKMPAAYPYKTVVQDADGKVQSSMVLVEIDTKVPDDALFKVPDDCKKMEMPTMPAKEE
jgi:hypothetical protein